jgi:hypothetical protein
MFFGVELQKILEIKFKDSNEIFGNISFISGIFTIEFIIEVVTSSIQM